MTEPIRKAMESMTGTRVETCPWRAFADPFVQRVMGCMPFFESGQLSFVAPAPSHKLVQGIAYYAGVDNRMHGKQLDAERDSRRRAAEHNAAQHAGRGSHGR